MLALALMLGALLVAGSHAAAHLRTLTLGEPMGMWETTYVAIARAWPYQYQFGNFVAGHDNYGPGFPAFCRPFLALVADPYVAQRLANLTALLAATGALAWILRGNRCSWPVTAATSAAFYALHAGSYSVQIRPDFLLAALMLVLVGIGQPGRRARGGALVAGAVFGAVALAAYLTKPYGIFAWAAVLTHRLLRTPGRESIIFGLTSAIVLAGGLLLYATQQPYYWLETFTAHLAHTSTDAHWLGAQSRDFLVLTFGFAVLALIGVVRRLKHAGAGQASRGWLARLLADDPPTATDTGYWTWLLAAGSAAFLAGPGWHTGAYLTYAFHLILPALLVLAAMTATRLEASLAGVRRHGAPLLLSANLVVLVALAPAPPAPDPGWDALVADVHRQPGRVLVDFILEPVSRQRDGVLVLGNGTTAFALGEPALIKSDSAIVRRARAEVAQWETDFRVRLESQGLPAAIYLEYGLERDATGAARWEMVPRGGLAYLLSGHIDRYEPAGTFRIHPYQFATNLPRQESANRETQVLKLVLKPVP